MEDKSDDRDRVVARLCADLVGPRKDEEELDSRPSDVYLTGILWPSHISMTKEDDEHLEVANSTDTSEAGDDSIKAIGVSKPSTAGLSFNVSSGRQPNIQITTSFATYELRKTDNKSVWKRIKHCVKFSYEVRFGVQSDTIKLMDYNSSVPDVRIHFRFIKLENSVLVTTTLINNIKTESGRNPREHATLFQTSLRVEPSAGTVLVPKPNSVDRLYEDFENFDDNEVTDDHSNALLYRNVDEFVTGHVCSATHETSGELFGDLSCATCVETTWIPSIIVRGADPNGHKVFAQVLEECGKFNPYSARELAFADFDTLVFGLTKFCGAYENWLVEQNGRIKNPKEVQPELVEVAEQHIGRCWLVLNRMKNTIEEFKKDKRLLRSFQLANLAMHVQYEWTKTPNQPGTLRWRPFQLGFLLLSVPSTVYKDHKDRDIMDLLWFPTGGGKTEAYLGLIACLAIYRRLSDDPADHSGVCAFMRYTLRLLTTQQFARSTALIMALEAIRLGKVDSPDGLALNGNAEFSIGLWVGQAATPNRRKDAYDSLKQNSKEHSSPIQLTKCPCCQKKLSWTIASRYSEVEVKCLNRNCIISGVLPIHTVDEDVYEVRPTLLVGTIDKFAQIVRYEEVNRLFGITDGSPPDLIIQDELHLISGPLGTIAGAYEAAIDLLLEANGNKTKIVGSTATIRNAPEQVKALFNRTALQFPPPALDHDNFGFTVPDNRVEALGRRYLGITTAGRSPKFSLQVVSGSLLQSAYGEFHDSASRDAYWTMVAYFNSLRELGGAVVLMQDVVKGFINVFADSRSESVRPLKNVQELTSRRTQAEIRDMLEILDRKCDEAGSADIVLATNMVSVGIDISRLGLMLVNGQPKSVAEYIQSTSRVGRAEIGGIVVSILNNSRNRDRSHFETFRNWHKTLYRDVEATSVTPFSARARDRALHAILVACVRHLIPDMRTSPANIRVHKKKVMRLIELVTDRAHKIDPDEKEVRNELVSLFENWKKMSPQKYWDDFNLHKSLLQSAENVEVKRIFSHTASNAWPTLNSMRTVEKGTPFRMAEYLRARENDSKI